MTERQQARIASDNARGAVRAMARNVENLARLLAIRTAECNALRKALAVKNLAACKPDEETGCLFDSVDETPKGEGHE